MGLFDIKPTPVSDNSNDWVYEAHYKHGERVVSFKFNPIEGAHPEESARNIVFQDFKDDSGYIPQVRYVIYLQAQQSLTVKKHHQIKV